MAWKPFLIKDFLGISTKRNPPANAAASIIGLDLRGTEGDLVSPPKYEALFATNPLPTDTYFDFATFLGMTTHYFPALVDGTHPTGAEVTILAYKGTITPVSGSLPSGFDGKIVGFWMRPYWNGAGNTWMDGWKWINEIRVYSYISSGYAISLSGFTPDTPYHYALYDKANNKFGYLYSLTLSNRNDFAASGTMIVMTNHYPLAYLGASGIHGVTSETIDWNKVLDDVRIGFGGQANRLAVGIGHRNKFFQIASWSYTEFDDILFDPYNIITDSGTFNIYPIKTATTIAAGRRSLLSVLNNYSNPSIRVTAMLDDFNEFLVYESDLETAALPLTTAEPNLAIAPEIRFATMNKRITAFKIYVASGEIAEGKVYTFTREIRVSEGTAGVGWEFDSSGNIILTAGSSNPVINNSLVSTISGKNYLIIDGEIFADGLSTTLDKDYLGYTPTLEYVKDWQQAIITNGKTHVIGPYIDQKYQNYIMRSAIGADATMWDVITSQDLITLENRDGNDVVGAEVLPNMDLVVARRNNIQQVDPSSGLARTLVSSAGLVSKKGILKTGDKIIIMSDYDVFSFSYNSFENLTQDTIRDAYRAALPASFDVNLVRDVYGDSFRFYIEDTNTEYIFTPGKGFVSRTLHAMGTAEIIGYAINKNGEVLVAQEISGTITLHKYNNSDYENGTIEYKTEPIDLKSLFPNMRENDRGLLRSVWIEYESPTAFAIEVLRDDNAALSKNVNVPIDITNGYYAQRLPAGINFRKLQLRVYETIDDYDEEAPPNHLTKFRIKAIGGELDIIPVGLHG